MSNKVSAVVLTIHVKLPGSNIIRVETVLTGGAGTLTEAFQGGQSTIGLTITNGELLKPLKDGELVFVSGEMNGSPITLPGALKTINAGKPWEFTGKFGSTGP